MNDIQLCQQTSWYYSSLTKEDYKCLPAPEVSIKKININGLLRWVIAERNCEMTAMEKISISHQVVIY